MNYKFYIDSDNKNEVLDEITRLSERKEKSKDSRIKFNKIYLQLNLLNNVGLNLPEIILKHLEDGLWELRPGRQRIIFYLDNNEALLLTIFVKRTNKTPKRELARAKKVRDEYIRRKNNNNYEKQ